MVVKTNSNTHMRAYYFKIALSLSFIVTLLLLIYPLRVDAFLYGSGGYGNCQYNTCGITLTLASGGSLSIPVTPTTSGRCSVRSDAATVVTHSDSGYTLLLNDVDTSNDLTRTLGGSIPSTSGTPASPTMLSANTWGFRIDGLGNFGAGPTSSATDIVTPSSLFAAVPLSNQSPAAIAVTGESTGTGVVNTIWYGLCVTSEKPAGTYVNDVLYTAVVN